jgi:cardiolipin synthase
VLAIAAAHRTVLHVGRRPSWPPPPGAVTPAEAEAATAGGGPLDFAWSAAATLEPFVEGREFFPRILADVEAARSSVHILMFGWREGEVGMRMATLLERKLAEGVEVRIRVDEFGSKPFKQAREMYEGLTAAGAHLEVNRFLRDQPGRVDHRKLYVIDGAVAWTGGAGIEDHFEDGRFHDVMVRVTGDVVRQAQAAFLTSLRERPAGLSHLFPDPEDAGSIPVALAQVLTGGFVAASQATLAQIAGARERLDVMNPYLTDRDAIEAIATAAGRGVRVRVVVSERSNNHLATAALKHRYAELIEAGVELWEIPGTVVHAKVVVADDVVSFGTVNLDAWALYRNSELMMIARSAELAALFEERLFGPDIARANRGRPPAGARARAEGWACHKLAYYL